MVRKRYLTILSTFVALLTLAQQSKRPEDQKKAMVDYYADISRTKDKGAYVELIGNVVFYHNGVFITCDTAYRYSEQHMEGVGNVIINSDSTYIYGDKFVYNGETNVARVFSPLIKTIDNDAILYTRNMEFNTLNNIGKYYGGGTTTQSGNLMESERGLYNVDERSLLLTGAVEMKNENYRIISDSVNYNFNSEIITFLDTTNIWNHEGEFLQAKEGSYNTKMEVYELYKDAYILTKDRELWSDSLTYKSLLQSAELKRNIQILDTIKNVIVVGDNGKYWEKSKRVIMSQKPAVINYGKDNPDSVFLCGDTLLMIPMLEPYIAENDSVVISVADTIDINNNVSSVAEIMHSDSINNLPPLVDADSLAGVADSLGVAGKIEEVNGLVEGENRGIGGKGGEEAVLSPQDGDSISNVSKVEGAIDSEVAQADTVLTKNALDSVDNKLLSKKELKKLEKEKKQLEKMKERAAKKVERDEKRRMRAIKYGLIDTTKVDTAIIDSTLRDSVLTESDLLKNMKRSADSSDYFIYAIKNVKNYKRDMQMVCDSMVVNSLDSTYSFYKKPFVWNEKNQITADSMVLYMKNGEAERGELFNFPILAQNIEDVKYNQIRGKYMEAFFVENSIDVLYVDGNSECIYYMQDQENGGDISGMVKVTSANMELYFSDDQISDIKWFNDYNFNVYPMTRLDEAESETVAEFVWEDLLRPKSRYDVTNRTIRQSERYIKELIETPLFNITESIEKERIKLIDSGEWRDRDEDVPVNKAEYVHGSF